MLTHLWEMLRTPAAIVFVLGIVIFIHELGHFLAAKWAGVYAPRFSIGFGPALWSRKWGDTEYVLAAFPLGGYVRMASREDEPVAFLEGGPEREAPHTELVGGNDSRVMPEQGTTRLPRHYDPDGIAPFGPNPVPADRLFESKPLYKRLVIMLAGVTFNFLLAFVILSALYVALGTPHLDTRELNTVKPIAGAPQLQQQLAAGDTVVAVNGAPVRYWEDVTEGIVRSERDTITIRTNRSQVAIPVGGKVTRLELARALEPALPPVVGMVEPGLPADRAGLEQGDRIIAAGGSPTRTWYDLVDVLQRSPGKPVTLEVARAGSQRTVTLTPTPTEEASPESGEKRTVGKIGIAVQTPTAYEPMGFGSAVVTGWQQTIGLTGAVFGELKKIATGLVSPRQLGGIIQIASASGQAARSGFADLVFWLALISVNLAVFNLLPIPILDGGQIVLNVLESIRGRAFSERTRATIAYVGLSAIAMLFLLTVFNDLTRG